MDPQPPIRRGLGQAELLAGKDVEELVGDDHAAERPVPLQCARVDLTDLEEPGVDEVVQALALARPQPRVHLADHVADAVDEWAPARCLALVIDPGEGIERERAVAGAQLENREWASAGSAPEATSSARTSRAASA